MHAALPSCRVLPYTAPSLHTSATVAPAAHAAQVLPQPSQLVTVTLPRPLGIVFEEDARKKRVVVAGFLPGKPRFCPLCPGLQGQCVRLLQDSGPSLAGTLAGQQPLGAQGAARLFCGWACLGSASHAVGAAAAGGNAEQRVRRAKLDPGLAARVPQEGDVLRACTCTNILYRTGEGA